MAGLLVSVRNAAEALLAVEGGAALIDVKEPDNGSLGRAAPEVLAGVLAAVHGQRPISAALGELSDAPQLPPELSQLAFVKWGLAGCLPDWQETWRQLRARVETTSPCRVVMTAYADWRRAAAPALTEVAYHAVRERGSVLLLDTWHKDGTTLLDWLSLMELQEIRELCRGGETRLALAGSLGSDTIRMLLPVQPHWFAVRGAVCSHGMRKGSLEVERVRELVGLLNSATRAG